jgi:hypothetical protein
MDRSQHFIAADSFDVDALLTDWRWLVGMGPYSVHRATAMGSLFLRRPDGDIYFLDSTHGSFDRVAGSPEEFEALWEDRHKRRYLLQAYLVRELRNLGVALGPGQCYSWKIPPHFGGEPLAKNIEPADLLVHMSLQGQLHKQAHALPPGTLITEVYIGAPDPPPG